MLADAIAGLRAIEAESSTAGVLDRLCKTLVFVVGATACSVSRVEGELLVDVTGHALREVWLGDGQAYRIADFPATGEVLRSGMPRTISFADPDVDPAEAFVLRDLEMNALLMVPIVVGGRPWGLVELYEMRLRAFEDDEVAVARFLVHQAERRIEAAADEWDSPRASRIYELPSDARARRVR
jgi:GAF domain-containing protein